MTCQELKDGALFCESSIPNVKMRYERGDLCDARIVVYDGYSGRERTLCYVKDENITEDGFFFHNRILGAYVTGFVKFSKLEKV